MACLAGRLLVAITKSSIGSPKLKKCCGEDHVRKEWVDGLKGAAVLVNASEIDNALRCLNHNCLGSDAVSQVHCSVDQGVEEDKKDVVVPYPASVGKHLTKG